MQITEFLEHHQEMQRPSGFPLTDRYQSTLHCKLQLGATEFDLYIIRFLRTRDLPPVRRQNNRRKVVSPRVSLSVAVELKRTEVCLTGAAKTQVEKEYHDREELPGGLCLCLLTLHTQFSYHFSLSYPRTSLRSAESIV